MQLKTNVDGTWKIGLGFLIMSTFTMANGQPVQEGSGHTVQHIAHYGYMVEVHTCNVKDAGTNSNVALNPIARAGSQQITFGWMQDWTFIVAGTGSKYDDHEQNQWDTYFFPETTRIDSIVQMLAVSDGSGDGPGWCLDQAFITRIESDLAVRSWVWNGPSPFIYKGTTVLSNTTEWSTFVPMMGTIPLVRQVPANLFLLFDLQKLYPSNATTGAVAVQYSVNGPCTGVRSFALNNGSVPVKTINGVQVGASCFYTTSFNGVQPGSARISVQDACESFGVSAGRLVSVSMAPGRSTCR